MTSIALGYGEVPGAHDPRMAANYLAAQTAVMSEVSLPAAEAQAMLYSPAKLAGELSLAAGETVVFSPVRKGSDPNKFRSAKIIGADGKETGVVDLNARYPGRLRRSLGWLGVNQDAAVTMTRTETPSE